MFLRIFGLLLFLAVAPPAAERSNILLIVSDDQGHPTSARYETWRADASEPRGPFRDY